MKGFYGFIIILGIFIGYHLLDDLHDIRILKKIESLAIKPNSEFGPGIIDVESFFNTPEDYLIVDVREDEEYDYSRFNHPHLRMRLGEIFNNKAFHLQLMKEKRKLLFICYTGDRSYEARKWLEMKYPFHDFEAYSLRGGVKFVWPRLEKNAEYRDQFWIGPLKTETPDYPGNAIISRRKILNTDVVVLTNELLYESWKDPKEKIQFHMRNKSDAEMEQFLKQIEGKRVSIVCGSWSECYYTRILGHRIYNRQSSQYIGYLPEHTNENK